MVPSPHSLISLAGRTILEYDLFKQHDTVVVAVSGGIDSVALLDYLAERVDLSLQLVVAHVNHCLRGEESDLDEAFVRDLAVRYGLKMESVLVDVRALALKSRMSVEEAGREVRYRFFAEVAEKVGASGIVLAHHLDDQAETVLMRLLRGSGTTGLSGMAPRSAAGRYIRPFLNLRRSAIEAYVRNRGLSFRTDSSNTDHSILRNRLRGDLIPRLEQYNPAISERLADTATIMAADEEIIARVIDATWSEIVCRKGLSVIIARGRLIHESLGIRLRLYRRALAEVKGDLRRIAARHLQAIDRLVMTGPPNGRLDLPAGIRALRQYEEIVISPPNVTCLAEGYELIIKEPGSYPLPGGGKVIVKVNDIGQADSAASSGIVVNLAAVPFPWLVRQFRPGDRLVPFGMSGRKKVKDIYIDEKVPSQLRNRIPLFFSGDTLFWVAGLRAAGSAVPGKDNGRNARVELLEFDKTAAMLG